MNKASDEQRKASYKQVSQAMQKQILGDNVAKKKSAEKPLKINLSFKDALKKVARTKTK
jgi:hypothetical protein